MIGSTAQAGRALTAASSAEVVGIRGFVAGLGEALTTVVAVDVAPVFERQEHQRMAEPVSDPAIAADFAGSVIDYLDFAGPITHTRG